MKTKSKFFKKVLPLLLTFNFQLFALFLFSQGTAINTSGAAADPSAMLDVSSNDKGVLIPRMSETERLGISSPARGLFVYQVGNNEGFWYYDGSSWMQFGDNLGNHTANNSLNMTNNKVVNLATCTQNLDAANKEYVDNAVAAGGGGQPTMLSDESSALYLLRNAIDYCITLTEGGYSDWYLPTMEEVWEVIMTTSSTINLPYSTNRIWTRTVSHSANSNGYDGMYHQIILSNGRVVGYDANGNTARVRCAR